MRDIRELENWITAHPGQARLYALGIGILILEVAGILEQLAEYAARVR